MWLPHQSPPVVRILYQGDYVERYSRIVWVSWWNLTDEEKNRQYERHAMVSVSGAGHC